MRSRWVKAWLGIVALAMLIAVTMLVPDMIRMLLEGMGILRPTNPKAVYEDMTFYGRGTGWNCFVGVNTGSAPPPPVGDKTTWEYKGRALADVYVVVKNEKPIRLRNFPEQLAAKLLEHRDQSDDDPRRLRYGQDDVFLDFHDGKLVYASFGESSRFQIGSSEAGPFVTFPIDRQTLVKTFGRPDHWKRGKSSWRP